MKLKSIVAASLWLIGASAFAAGTDLASLKSRLGIVEQDVKIIKASDRPAFTVRYSGIKVAKIEIRLNGASLGIRNVSSKKTEGEANFAVDISLLQKGDNLIEAVLLDASGKILTTGKTVITIETGEKLPVSIRYPRTGDTVMGTVPIEVEIGLQTKETYISFFVDKEFRHMRNFPPYTFYWDTTREQNGWHEVEVWSYDETQTTRKSPVIRLFVQNPGGRTERVPVPPPAKTNNTYGVLSEPVIYATLGAAKGIRTNANQPAPPLGNPAPPAVMPTMSTPAVSPTLGGMRGVKGAELLTPQPSGIRIANPGSISTQPAKPKEIGATSNPEISPALSKSAGMRISREPEPSAETKTGSPSKNIVKKGSRVPMKGNFSLSLNEKDVNFDVNTRVENGIPLAPFRHIFETYGGKVNWMASSHSVIASGNGNEVRIKIGYPIAKVNGRMFSFEISPFIERGRTFVPLSFFAETLGWQIEYDVETGHVWITTTTVAKK
ncbi:MAG TPA: stalk domain-containing protein [Fimbriimonadales bacterium]|nr:stalk domain-containing protein [Fimbriimonadales bacterium]